MSVDNFYPGSDNHPVDEAEVARKLDGTAFNPPLPTTDAQGNPISYSVRDWIQSGQFSSTGNTLSLPDGSTFTPTGQGVTPGQADSMFVRYDQDETYSGAAQATARGNIGLGDSATRDVGTTINDVAAGMHTHTASEITDFTTAVESNTEVAANTAARHDAVTLSGLDYLTLADQVITLGSVDLTSDVTGALPVASINQTELNNRIDQRAAAIGSVHQFNSNNFPTNTVTWHVGDILLYTPDPSTPSNVVTYLYVGTNDSTSTSLNDFQQITISGGGISQATADARYAPINHTQTASTITDFDTAVAANSAVAANTAKTGITAAQATAITANTAKVTFPGFGTTATTAAAGNHNHDNRYARYDAAQTLTNAQQVQLLTNIGAHSGLISPNSLQNGDFTASAQNIYVLDNIMANATVTLPTGSNGQEIRIVNISTLQPTNPSEPRTSGVWSLSPQSTQRIHGLPLGESMDLDVPTACFHLTYTNDDAGWALTGI